MNDRRDGAVVKLGGSVVTDKARDELRVAEERVRLLADELAAAPRRPLAIVHGAGSWGHRIVQRTGIHEGLTGPDSLLAMGETQRLQYELDARIAAILLDAGLPVMPVQASASARMEARQLRAMDLDALRGMVDHGLIPLLYGVPAWDTAQGCSILSGDQIAPYVAHGLGAARVVHGTDVDGVFEADPAAEPGARPIPAIHRGNWDDVRGRLAGSRSVDVTGGMAGKVAALIDWARRGVEARIVDARTAGRVTAAMAGEPVGTLVCWEER